MSRRGSRRSRGFPGPDGRLVGFAKLLRVERLVAGMTVDQLAERSHIPATVIANLEAALRRPTFAELSLVGAALRVGDPAGAVAVALALADRAGPLLHGPRAGLVQRRLAMAHAAAEARGVALTESMLRGAAGLGLERDPRTAAAIDRFWAATGGDDG